MSASIDTSRVVGGVGNCPRTAWLPITTKSRSSAIAAAARRMCSSAARFIGAHDRASLFRGQQSGKGAGLQQARDLVARRAEQRDRVRERRGDLDTNLIDCARNRPTPPQPAGRWFQKTLQNRQDPSPSSPAFSPLDHVIGVQIPASQPSASAASRSQAATARCLAEAGGGEESRRTAAKADPRQRVEPSPATGPRTLERRRLSRRSGRRSASHRRRAAKADPRQRI